MKSKKKILFVNASSEYDTIGGTISAFSDIFSSLKENNFIINFISQNLYKNKFTSINYKTYNLLLLPNCKRNFFYFVFIVIKNYNLIKQKLDVDYIWVHSPLPWFFIKLFFNIDSKVIYTLHGPLKKEIKANRGNLIKIFFANFILNFNLRNVYKIHTNSKYVYLSSLSENKHLKSKKLFTDEILVSNKKFMKSYFEEKSKNSIFDNYYLICRRLFPRTGVLELIKIIYLNKYFNKFNFIFTGDGPLFNELNKYKKNNIHILGNIDDKKLLNLKIHSLGTIIPSIEAEGYSVIAKEYILMKKNIFHTNQGGLKESIVDYKLSYIFNINNNQTLIEKFKAANHDKKYLLKSDNINKDDMFKKINNLFK